MDKKTYKIISKTPIIGTIFNLLFIDPTINCSPFKETEYYNKIVEYQKKHPNEIITKNTLKKIFKD